MKIRTNQTKSQNNHLHTSPLIILLHCLEKADYEYKNDRMGSDKTFVSLPPTIANSHFRH